MATQNFDQLNNLRGYAETWFSKMEIPDKDKKKRVDLAMDFTEIMLMLFELIMESQISKDTAKAFLVERTKIIADNYIGKENTAYITDWSRLESEKIVEDTYKMVAEAKKSEETKTEEPKASTTEPMKETEVEETTETTKPTMHFDEYDVDIPKDEYPTSDFRGMLLGVECATSVANYDDFYQAVEKHGATRKVWISEADGRVRATHDEAHGQERPIAKLFEVGGSELMFPGDITHGADMKEIYNCRCHVEYIMGNSEYIVLARTGNIYVHSTDNLSVFAKKIKPYEDFEDFVSHGDEYGLEFRDGNGKEENISAEEFLNMILESGTYNGGNIRLIACRTGADPAIVPQYLADKLGVTVMAPTTNVDVDFDGNLTVANRDEDGTIIEEGEWRFFYPRDGK